MIKTPFIVTVPTSIDEQRVSDLLVSAFEGGSNYWIEKISKLVEPVERKFECEDNEDGFMKKYEYPFNMGGEVHIKVCDDDKTYILNRAAIERGLTTMATKFSRHFNDFISENDDAETGDVFLQCCLFDDVIFG